MKRRIILVAAIVIVTCGLVGGLVWYFHYTGGSSLLKRAQVALEARKYEKALDLATQYAGETDDWQGYLVIGRAQNALGDHDAARTALDKARAGKSNQDIYIALADTYALPARKLLAQRGGDRLASVDKAIALFESATVAVESYPQKDVPPALKAYDGLNYMARARATIARSEALMRLAGIDRAGEMTQEAALHIAQAQDAQKKSQEQYRRAAEVLLGVVQADPTHAVAADALAQVGIELKDPVIIDQARKALSAAPLEKRPPLAWGQLVLQDMPLTHYPVPEPLRSQCIAKLDEIESLLAKHNNENLSSEDLCLLRRRMGQTYMRLDLDAKAMAMFDFALKADGRDPLSQLFRGQVLLAKGDLDGAHAQLYALVSSYGDWSEGHYWYAQVAIKQGDTTLAMQSLRRCTQLDRNHAASRRAIIDLLLAQKPPKAQDAYDDALELLAIDPTDSGAIDRFVAVVQLLNRPELAQSQLARIQQDYANQASVLWSVLQAYSKLSPDGVQQRGVAARIIALPAKTTDDRIIQARAYEVLGRQSEAEGVLQELVRQQPTFAMLQYELGMHHDRLGRLFQASECYTRALELDRKNKLYNKALARVMIRMGNTDSGSQLLEQLRQGSPGDAATIMLDAQLDLIHEGDPAAVVAKLQKVISKDEANVLVAYFELQKGNTDQCISLCSKVLAKEPNDVEALGLLAQAWQAKGMHKQAIDTYKQIIAQRAESIVSYVAMAGQVIAAMTPDQRRDVDAKTILAAMQCPAAREDLMQLAVGKVLEDNRRYAMAAEVYLLLSEDPGAPRESREQARLREALCCYTLGKTDVALELLGALKIAGPMQHEGAQAYAQIMCNLGRGQEAQADIQALWDKSLQNEDYNQLVETGRLMIAAGAGDKAIAALDKAAQAAAKDVRPYRLMTYLLRLMGQDSKSLPIYEKILQLQPGNFRAYTQYASTLDRCQNAVGAMAVLDRLQDQGKAGQYQAVLARASMLAQWGLKSEAVAAFRQSETYYKTSPPMLFAIAQQYQALGERGEVRRVLAMVPQDSPLYRRAQTTMAMAQDTPDQQVAALLEIAKANGMNAALLGLIMQVQLDSQHAAAALAQYKQSNLPPAELQASPAPALALGAMIQLKQLPEASELATSMVRQDATSWRPMAVLLCMAQGKAEQARALLGPADTAGLNEAVAGVVASDPAKADAYYRRALQLYSQANLLPAQKASQAALLHLAMGKADLAAKELDTLKGLGMMVYDGPAELVKAKDTQKAEARKLLLVSLAYNLQQPGIARKLAIEALNARPSCTWAAVLAMRGADAQNIVQLQSIYADQTGALGCRLAAMTAMIKNDPTTAVTHLEKALELRPGDAEVLIQLAEACQKSGNAKKALDVYTQAMAAKAGPFATNNAAYLVTSLYVGDKAKLAQARTWIDQAIKDNPNDVSLYDTAGWLAYLLGNKDQACRELHLAVKAMPASPDVHYHMGMAHKLAGHAALAKMHLKQAIDLGQQMQAQGQKVSPETEQSIKLAKAEVNTFQ